MNNFPTIDIICVHNGGVLLHKRTFENGERFLLTTPINIGIVVIPPNGVNDNKEQTP